MTATTVNGSLLPKVGGILALILFVFGIGVWVGRNDNRSEIAALRGNLETHIEVARTERREFRDSAGEQRAELRRRIDELQQRERERERERKVPTR
jgi:hypothetical protein